STSASAACAALLFAVPRRRVVPVSPEAGRLLQRVLLLIALAAAMAAVLTLVAEPIAAWVGQRLFHAHPVYAKRPHSFLHYFETQIQPEIHRIATAVRLPFLA